MIISLLLLPLVSALAIIFGSPAKKTALVGAGLTLVLGLAAAATWHSGQADAISYLVFEKPTIHFALGLPDGLSLVMMLLSVIVLFAAVLTSEAPEGREKIWYTSSLLIGGGLSVPFCPQTFSSSTLSTNSLSFRRSS